MHGSETDDDTAGTVTVATGPALEPVTGPALGPVAETADAAIGVDGEAVKLTTDRQICYIPVGILL